MTDSGVPEEAVEQLAESRWNRGWFDDQGMARWTKAKRLGMPGVEGALKKARADLEAALDTQEDDK